MTIAEGMDSIFEIVSLAIMSHKLGHNVLIACIVTHLLIELTHVFLAGPFDALYTICSHAAGAENYHLAGQYIQIAAVLYLLVGVPMLGVWYIWIGDVARLMGFGEEIVQITLIL